MTVEADELRERLQTLNEQCETAKAQAETLRVECEQLTAALRRVLDLLPDQKKDEALRLLVMTGGKP